MCVLFFSFLISFLHFSLLLLFFKQFSFLHHLFCLHLASFHYLFAIIINIMPPDQICFCSCCYGVVVQFQIVSLCTRFSLKFITIFFCFVFLNKFSLLYTVQYNTYVPPIYICMHIDECLANDSFFFLLIFFYIIVLIYFLLIFYFTFNSFHIVYTVYISIILS